MHIYITGITGTIGTELTKICLENGHNVSGISRDEFKQHHFKYKNDVDLYIGNICDYEDVLDSMNNVDLVIHTAAMKHVEKMQEFPRRSIETNIYGTQNVLRAAKSKGFPKVTFLSTDKAVYPINVYGHCKAIAEHLVMQTNTNAVVRYGNVLNSRGSVLTTFKNTLKEQGKCFITHPAMTRFFIKIEDAANFVYSVATSPDKTGLHVPKMKACKILDLAKAVNRVIYGESDRIYEIIGMRPGEKINECLKGRYEDVNGDYTNLPTSSKGDVYSDSVESFTDEELDELVASELL